MPDALHLLAAAVLLGYDPATLRSQPTPMCHAADRRSDELLAYIRTLVTSSDSTLVQLRTSVGLPAVDSAQVVLMNSDSSAAICQQARDSYVQFFEADTLEIPTVYVIKVGSSRYAVTDMRPRVGEFEAVHILDEQFSSVGAIAR